MVLTLIHPFNDLGFFVDKDSFSFGSFNMYKGLRKVSKLKGFLFNTIVVVALALGIGGASPIVVYSAVAVWGLTFGGAATLLQTALADAAGDGADVAQSMCVTVWNCAIAGGGIVGGFLLETQGVASFPWALLLSILVGLIIAALARRHGFPAGHRVFTNGEEKL